MSIDKIPYQLLITERLQQYVYLIRLNSPIGILLLLWPTLWALWLAAEGVPDLKILGIFVVGVVLMRSAGCAINDYVDRKIDPHVGRTQNRPIASGKVSPREAIVIFILLYVIAFGLVLFTNKLTIYYSFGAATLAVIYSFMKRFTFIPQVILGAAFSMAIPMAFAAQTEKVPSIAWLLFTVNLVWIMAYDTMYAMADREEDLKIGVKSTAILFDESDVAITMSLHGMFLLGLYFVGESWALGQWFHVGIITAVVLMVHQFNLISTRKPEQCIRAFLNNNYVGMVIFSGIVVHYILLVE